MWEGKKGMFSKDDEKTGTRVNTLLFSLVILETQPKPVLGAHGSPHRGVEWAAGKSTFFTHGRLKQGKKIGIHCRQNMDLE